jgi:hypothetical protein
VNSARTVPLAMHARLVGAFSPLHFTKCCIACLEDVCENASYHMCRASQAAGKLADEEILVTI